jgi:hypothetical protein
MQTSFDLISDLYSETWDPYHWSGVATSPVCVVAGGISTYPEVALTVLKQLGQSYQAVFYIDGSSEHVSRMDDLEGSQDQLAHAVADIPNVVYLQENVVVVNGVAVVAVNGWWTYEFSSNFLAQHAIDMHQDITGWSDQTIQDIKQSALMDAAYLASSVKKLQTHKDVKKIMIVSHAVPNLNLVSHDIELSANAAINTIGNQHLELCFDADVKHKISTWAFGHYSGDVDQVINGVRYVNNARGVPADRLGKSVYYPKRIVIDL